MSNPRDGSVADRVAIVTGASRGVGRAVVHRLAGRGFAVVINYLHDQAAAEAIVDAILAANGDAVTIRADVADEMDVERLFAETIRAFGGVDAVVHTVHRRVTETPLAWADVDEFDALCRINLRAAFIVNREAARHVRNGGAIVNLSTPNRSGVYVATEAASDVFTRTLALELRERNVTVNAVSLDPGDRSAPTRVADVVAYLLSDDGHPLNGHLL